MDIYIFFILYFINMCTRACACMASYKYYNIIQWSCNDFSYIKRKV